MSAMPKTERDIMMADAAALERARYRAGSERVNHPLHYGGADNPFEHVKVAEALGWTALAFIYNCTKYLWRVDRKSGSPPLEDLRKARWYLEREIQRREREATTPAEAAECRDADQS